MIQSRIAPFALLVVGCLLLAFSSQRRTLAEEEVCPDKAYKPIECTDTSPECPVIPEGGDGPLTCCPQKESVLSEGTFDKTQTMMKKVWKLPNTDQTERVICYKEYRCTYDAEEGDCTVDLQSLPQVYKKLRTNRNRAK